ncbi:MAG: AAA family ATPase, partial [Anaerolineales bacterium]|nr:AAA family ATPase [Anaerolineales bacterium]
MPSRLKSLELQGYKTFANRTVFEYAGTITAIVGPNGSGKSNIADSIRWVLGEQSYSILRGKKTEDMIFSGSEQRPRAGMASATMVFDNSDGWLPIDFSEVAVTRRAYRDGQNEYLINGSRVRLKDVSELLAQSGLAERTYTVIGQGLVDAALALKAEERRRLFEEAAGIGLYRSRREEALRRLDSTRRNLERAQDILAELTPRLKSLERQARRAEEYEQMRSDLRVLMREWYGFHWHRAQVELAESRKLTQARLEVLDREREAQARIDEQLSSLRARIQTLRSELNSRHHQLAQLHARREEVSRERAAVDERARWQKQQEQSSREEIARLGEELELQREMADLANGEVTKLEDEMRSAQSEYQLAQAALETRLAERKRIEAELKIAQSRLQQVGDRKAELSAIQVQSQAQIERLQANLASLAGGLASLDGEIAQAQEAVEGASRQVGEAESAQKALEARLATQRQRIQRLEANRQEVEKKRAEILAEISRLATS